MLQNSNMSARKCRTPSPYTLIGVNTSVPPAPPTISVNTSIPPPPIVNLPRRLSHDNKDTSEVKTFFLFLNTVVEEIYY